MATNTNINNKPIPVKPLAMEPSAVAADGLSDVDTWIQAPTPTTASPGVPSLVTWKRGLGEDEARGLLEISEALRKGRAGLLRRPSSF